MASENSSGESGGERRRRIQDYGPARRVKPRETVNLHDVETESTRPANSMESDMGEAGSSQQGDRTKCLKNQGSENCSPEDEEEGSGSLEEQKLLSKEMEANIQHLRQKVDHFTQQVSGLLDAGKTYFLEASNAFEQGIVLLHQKVVERWEEEIEDLRNLDVLNEDMSNRLGDARNVIGRVHELPSSARHRYRESSD